MFEDMGWELPPTTRKAGPSDHYYHYPGVTLGIHRSLSYKLLYERVLFHAGLSSASSPMKVYHLSIPENLTAQDAVHLPIGNEELVVTCPETDSNGLLVFVTVLFYKAKAAGADCDCGCLLSPGAGGAGVRTGSGLEHSPELSLPKIPTAVAPDVKARTDAVDRKVHFAPLASVRYTF